MVLSAPVSFQGPLARLTASAAAAAAWMPTFLGCDGEHTPSPGGDSEGFHLAASPGAGLSGEREEAKNVLCCSLTGNWGQCLEAGVPVSRAGASWGPRLIRASCLSRKTERPQARRVRPGWTFVQALTSLNCATGSKAPTISDPQALYL